MQYPDFNHFVSGPDSNLETFFRFNFVNDDRKKSGFVSEQEEEEDENKT